VAGDGPRGGGWKSAVGRGGADPRCLVPPMLRSGVWIDRAVGDERQVKHRSAEHIRLGGAPRSTLRGALRALWGEPGPLRVPWGEPLYLGGAPLSTLGEPL
jgi:hypothetical protein